MGAFEYDSDTAGFCARCLKELISGRGEFYEIDIDARVDSSPPILDAPPMNPEQMDREWGKVIKQLESISQVDAENQVHCRRRILLCSPCFQVWIDDPAGES